MSRKKVVFRQMRTGEYWQDDRGGVWIDERLLRKRPRRPKRERVPDLDQDEDDDGEEEADADDVPESVEPSAWQFDDARQDVTIGGKVLHFQGGIQYQLLQFVAQGGTDLQEAWEKVWKYRSAFIWRTVWDAARHINKKFLLCKVVGKLKVGSKKISWQTSENTD